MEFFKKNRPVAALCLVVIIALSVIFGSWRSIDGIKGELANEFQKKDKYGETVSGTVDMLEKHIRTFVAEYKLALGNCVEANILTECADALNCVNGIIPYAAKIDDARNAAMLMHQRLDNEGKYSIEAKAAYAGIDNDISILRRYDDYNAAAKKYNEAASTLVGKLFGLGQALEF